MKTSSIGRVIGVLLFVQLVGLSLPFILMMPGVMTDYLNAAAPMAAQIRIAVFLLFANAAVTLGIAIVAFPVFRDYSLRMAIWLLAISTVWLVMQSVDNAHILSMLSLSQRYTDAAGANADLYNILGAQVRSTRVWVHYTELLVIDVWFALLYSTLLRFRFVSRLLGWFGLLAVVLHLIGIPLAMFISYPSIPWLGFSLAISHLLIGGWLVAKGFPERYQGDRSQETGGGTGSSGGGGVPGFLFSEAPRPSATLP